MAIVTKTRTYLTGDALPANYYNQDRDEMIAGINSIDNAQIASNAGILESKITFSGASGHGHTGGTDGKLIAAGAIDLTGLILPEAQVTFDPLAGHTHDGVGSAKVGALNLSVAGLGALAYLRVNAAGTDIEGAAAAPGVPPRTYILTDYQDVFVDTDVSPNPFVDVNVSVIQLTGVVKTAPVGADLICVVKELGGATIGTLTITDGSLTGTLDLSGTPYALAAGSFLSLDITQVGSTTAGSKLTVSVTATVP